MGNVGTHNLVLASVSEEIPGKARVGVRSASLASALCQHSTLKCFCSLSDAIHGWQGLPSPWLGNMQPTIICKNHCSSWVGKACISWLRPIINLPPPPHPRPNTPTGTPPSGLWKSLVGQRRTPLFPNLSPNSEYLRTYCVSQAGTASRVPL